MKHTQPTPMGADYARKLMFCALVLILLLVLALSCGTFTIPLSDVLPSLLGDSENASNQLVIQQIRLPRALLAVLIGAILGICGAATQGLFRNPLADPSLIGVTAGASAGAAISIFLVSSIATLHGFSGMAWVSFGAFAGGIITVLLVYALATDSNGTSVSTMLLVSIAITAIAGGITSILQFFADNEMLRRISIWQMGGLDGANFDRVLIAVSITALLCVSLPRFATSLNALLLGESEARHLGINLQRTKLFLIVLIALGVGVSVALAGSIVFVGLIVPHIMRLIVGPNHSRLLPLSAFGGAILLLGADTLARTIISPIELPVGLVTAFLGAPFFISLLSKRHEYGMR